MLLRYWETFKILCCFMIAKLKIFYKNFLVGKLNLAVAFL